MGFDRRSPGTIDVGVCPNRHRFLPPASRCPYCESEASSKKAPASGLLLALTRLQEPGSDRTLNLGIAELDQGGRVLCRVNSDRAGIGDRVSVFAVGDVYEVELSTRPEEASGSL